MNDNRCICWTWRETLLVSAFVAWLLLALLAALGIFACQKQTTATEPLPPVLSRTNDSPIEIEKRRVLCGPRSIDRDAGAR